MHEDGNFKQFRDEMALLGEAVLTYNDLIEAASLIYGIVIGFDNQTMQTVALSAWHSLNSDRSQIVMLRTAAKTRFESKEFAWPEAAEGIDWFCKKTIGFIEDRNNTVHSPLSLNFQDDKFTGIKASTTMGHPRALRLIDKDIVAELNWQSEYATTLKNYGISVSFTLHAGSGPLRSKPQLPNRGQKDTQQGQ